MTSRTGFFLLAAALVVVSLVCVLEGVQLIATGKVAGIGIGVSAFVIPAIGIWFLRQTIRFGRTTEAMSKELEAEGGLPVDELRRTSGAGSTVTRPTRCSAGARPRPRPPRRTGGSGSDSPSPTRTPATRRAPARPCTTPSSCAVDPGTTGDYPDGPGGSLGC